MEVEYKEGTLGSKSVPTQECLQFFTNPQLCFGHEACCKTETCPFGRDKPSFDRETSARPS